MTKTISEKSTGTKQKAAAKTPPPTAKSSGSKAEAIIALLRRDGGATLEEMMQATGWQKHSVRGFMAGALKKRHGLTVSSVKTEQGRSYRLHGEALS